MTSPPGRRRWSCLLLALAVVGSSLAQGGIAELDVTAYGRQRIDLASGRTVLEDGGELVDRGSGVRLVADWIAYAEGVDVVATGVAVEGELGVVEAPSVVIDLAQGRLVASGGVAWRRTGLQVTGETLWFDADAGIVGLLGGVEATEPAASAAEAWLDVAAGRVLLVGPYRYADGPFVLRGDAGASLQLDARDTGDGVAYDASTTVEADWLAAVAAARAIREAASDE